MIKKTVVLMLLLLLIVGCVKTGGFSSNQTSKKNESKKESVQNITESKENASNLTSKVIEPGLSVNTTDVVISAANITIESNDSAAPPAPPKSMNRIDVRTGTSSSDVTSDWDGKKETYTVPDVDFDAIAFDIAQHMGRGIREVRPFIYINGNPYLKPSELKKEQEKYAQKEMVTFNASLIPIIATKEQGFIRGVGCDLEKGYIRIDLVNPSENPVPIFKNNNIFPKVKNALLLSLNRRPLEDMDCGGSLIIQPGLKATCVRVGAVFISAGSRNQASTDAGYDTSQPDMVAASRPGHQEQIKFYCKKIV